MIADPIVRNWGTIGGSLCQADPSEDLSAAFGALRATAVIQGRDGPRQVPVREFHLGPYETVVAPDELLTELRVPIRPAAAAARTRRWPAGSVTGRWRRPAPCSSWTRTVRWPRWASAWPRSVPVTSWRPAPRTSCAARPADEATFARAGQIAAEHCEPAADQRGPVDYKRHLTGELTTRALRRAAARARGQEA